MSNSQTEVALFSSPLPHADSKQKRIGILGGGQLARMLLQDGQRCGLELAVYAGSESDPAAQVTSQTTFGQLNESEKLAQFLQSVDVVTFESEFIESRDLSTALEKANSVRSKASTRGPIEVRPHLSLIEILQDRSSQKTLFDQHKLQTSPWTEVNEVTTATEFWKKHQKSGVVFKQRRNGYDGYGTAFVRSELELKSFLDDRFRGEKATSGWIAEALVPFQKELAITFIRDEFDHVGHFPVVETQQQNGRCNWVRGPFPNRPELNRFIEQATKCLRGIQYVGAITFELFWIQGRQNSQTAPRLVVNELAPRVHNSCHYSLNLYGLNQFNGHLFAVAGLNLKTQLAALAHRRSFKGGFAMVNLLGPSDSRRQELLQSEGSGSNQGLSHSSWLHWYQKKDLRPGRKLGHITVLGQSSRSALKEALKLRNQFEETLFKIVK